MKETKGTKLKNIPQNLRVVRAVRGEQKSLNFNSYLQQAGRVSLLSPFTQNFFNHRGIDHAVERQIRFALLVEHRFGRGFGRQARIESGDEE